MKKKRNSSDEVKNEPVRSLVEGDVYKNDELAKRADNVTCYEEAVLVVKNTRQPLVRKRKAY